MATGLALPSFRMPAPPQMNSFGPTPTFQSSALVVKDPALDVVRQSDQLQNQPVIAGLVGHINGVWNQARAAKRVVETAMLEALYARRGQYTAEKLAKIQASKQPAIYMMVASSKMRQIESLVRDTMMGTGIDKPWTLDPSPDPEIPPAIRDQIAQGLAAEIEQAMQMGIQPTMEQVRQRLREVRDQVDAQVREEARATCARMETKMEDQLLEGGWLNAMDGFISDFATFKTAFIKGPVIRNKPKLSWSPEGELVVETKLTLGWERADPFDIYPASWARNINEGPLIQKHRLTREDLTHLIGVEGYSEPSIRRVLDEYGTGGLKNWLAVDAQKNVAEGDSSIALQDTGLIDALQFWGSASGKMLLDWGLPKAQVPDANKEYQIEAWLIGTYVIKAVLNADPLARRPYYGYSFQTNPGSVWGNSPYDLMSDCQDMCNAAARSLAANLGISSGPQVAILSNRLPAGEDVTEMYPWKIWQFESDPMGSTAAPITFFQPTSNAAELMSVYGQFSQLADEYTGIPKYMAGFNEGSGGAGRTASGMSMMIGNAGKVIKQGVAGIDLNITTPLLERQYYYNMRYSDDPELKGDVQVRARGALSMMVKESAQVRRNEFLAATNNPTDMQIVGLDGRAEVLRQTVQTLDMNADKVVPTVAAMKQKQAVQAMQMQQMQQQQMQEGAPEGGGQQPTDGSGATNNQQTLMNQAPITDNF